MKSFQIILLLFFSLSCRAIAQRHVQYKWEKIKTPINSYLIYAGGNSIHDFWSYTTGGTFVHYKNGNFNIYPIPSNYKLNSFVVYQTGDDEFLCMGLNSNWRSLIFFIRNGRWEKMKYEHEVPISHFIKTTNNKIYAGANFGGLLLLKDDNWITIETPYENHTTGMLAIGDSLYISTLNEGIYIYYEGKFKNIVTESGEHPLIIQLRKDNNNIIGYSAESRSYIIENDTLKVYPERDKKIHAQIQLQNNKFGFQSIYQEVNNEEIEVVVPMEFNAISFKLFSIDEVLILSRDGYLIFGKKTDTNYFIDLSTSFRINEIPNSSTYAGIFSDIDNNSQQDLLLVNRYRGEYLTLYKGIANSPFANQTYQSNLSYKDEIHYTVSTIDFDKDGFNDFIFLNKDSSGFFISFYKNLGDDTFEYSGKLYTPEEFNVRGISQISSTDFDNDGDEDILITAYYEKNGLPGKLLLAENKLWGKFGGFNYSLANRSLGWNYKTIFADVNNDDLNDIYSLNVYRHDRLLINKGNKYEDEAQRIIKPYEKSENYNAGFIDFDNDGDLDLFTIGRNNPLSLFQNNGSGVFTDISAKALPAEFASREDVFLSDNLNFGDFNNDGFVDVFLTINKPGDERNRLLINKMGKYFVDEADKFQIVNPALSLSIIADVDNDGDLDIFGGTGKHNMLWINTLNDSNFLRIKLKGVISNTNALGSKIWVYKNGHLDDNKYLIGFRQIASYQYSGNTSNELTAHFGLNNNELYDIKINFYAGKQIVLKSVKAGQTIIVEELSGAAKFFYTLPGILFRFITKTESQIYIVIVIIAHIVLLLGVKFGTQKFRWNNKLAVGFTAINGSLFWIILSLVSTSQLFYLKYIFPLLISIVSTAIPLLVFMFIFKSRKSEKTDYKDKLLQKIMSFAHGEWGMRNLNSIILLCENITPVQFQNQQFIQKLDERFKTFKEIISPAIKEIIEYCLMIDYDNEVIAELVASNEKLNTEMNKFKFQEDADSIIKIKSDVIRVKEIITEIKEYLYAEFSTNPVEVINNVINNYSQTLTEQKIELKKYKEFPDDLTVFIRGYELGNILDNLFQNSIRYMKKPDRKEITILLRKDSPKIIIDFTNSGEPISADKIEKIFEIGYSESKSTGAGLFISRELLKKYGGRIFVKESNNERVTFSIELNEGISK